MLYCPPVWQGPAGSFLPGRWFRALGFKAKVLEFKAKVLGFKAKVLEFKAKVVGFKAKVLEFKFSFLGPSELKFLHKPYTAFYKRAPNPTT